MVIHGSMDMVCAFLVKACDVEVAISCALVLHRAKSAPQIQDSGHWTTDFRLLFSRPVVAAADPTLRFIA